MDDPTIRRVQSFTKIAGHKKLWLMNLIPRRATNPENLRGLTYEQAFDSKEDSPIVDLTSTLEKPEAIVCAWGALVTDPSIHDLARTGILKMYKTVTKAWPDIKFKCLGKTLKDEHPRHPLYIKGNQTLEAFDFKKYVHQINNE